MGADARALTGQSVGSYTLLEPIGTGGMGEVYRARHDLIGSMAAVKVLHKKYAGEASLVQRFFNEAKAASAVRHPGMVEVFDFGRTDDGGVYLVMELLDGETLRDRLKREGPLAESDVADFAKQLASVLAAAHSAQIVHRDLKPENIFIVEDALAPRGHRLKLLDFGIAKLTTPDDQLTLTQTGAVMGTPVYMSPEQCRGTGKYDGRTDLYSLGCIMFEMLTGRPPFVSKFVGDYYIAHISESPPELDELRQGLPQGLQGMVSRLLEKDPQNRLPSAAELGVLLDNLYDDESTTVARVPAMTGRYDLDTPTLQPGSESSTSTVDRTLREDDDDDQDLENDEEDATYRQLSPGETSTEPPTHRLQRPLSHSGSAGLTAPLRNPSSRPEPPAPGRPTTPIQAARPASSPPRATTARASMPRPGAPAGRWLIAGFGFALCIAGVVAFLLKGTGTADDSASEASDDTAESADAVDEQTTTTDSPAKAAADPHSSDDPIPTTDSEGHTGEDPADSVIEQPASADQTIARPAPPAGSSPDPGATETKVETKTATDAEIKTATDAETETETEKEAATAGSASGPTGVAAAVERPLDRKRPARRKGSAKPRRNSDKRVKDKNATVNPFQR